MVSSVKQKSFSLSGSKEEMEVSINIPLIDPTNKKYGLTKYMMLLAHNYLIIVTLARKFV